MKERYENNGGKHFSVLTGSKTRVTATSNGLEGSGHQKKENTCKVVWCCTQKDDEICSLRCSRLK